jgi:ABC-type nitrate/sulfonate/bicarbonate transport system permease component
MATSAAGPHRFARFAPTLTGLAAIFVLLVLWQGVVEAGWVSPFVAPAPLDIARSFPALFEQENLLGAFLQTSVETLVAAVLATLIGVPFGWWLHRHAWAGLAYESWVGALAAAPLVLLYPLFLVFFGRNAMTIVVMSFLSGLPPIALKTKEGLDGVRRVLVNVGRSYGLTPSQQFWKIMLPAAIPVIANGVRLGLIFALINVVGIEFLINFGGLGELVANLAERFEIPAMYGAILFVMLANVAFFFVTEKVERWLRAG